MPLIKPSADRFKPIGTDSTLRIAGKDTWGHVVANSVAAVIAALLIFLVGVGLRWLWHWQIDWNDLSGQWWSVYSLAICSLLYFLFHFIRAPLKKEIARNDGKIVALDTQVKELQRRCAEIPPLKEHLASLEAKHPKLTIEFRENDDDFICRDWFHIKIMNESTISSAHNSVVAITRLSEVGKDGASVIARKANGTPFPWVLGTSAKSWSRDQMCQEFFRDQLVSISIHVNAK